VPPDTYQRHPGRVYVEHFVAYEYGAGRATSPLAGRMSVQSRTQAHLLRALSNKVWIICESGRRDGALDLNGVYIAANVREAGSGGFLLEGAEGFDFDPPVALNDAETLECLRESRSKQRSGLDRIRDESVIDRLLEIEHQARQSHRGKSRSQPESERRIVYRTATRRDASRSQRENAAAQSHAMACAMEYYRLRWRNVTDVSEREAYDIHCDDPKGRVLTVKVRGTTGSWENLFLNAAEERHAREAYPDVALFVLYDVSIVVDTDGVQVGRGGTTHVIDPWDISLDDLTPLVFGCRLARSRNVKHSAR